jgi:hypothetical protein
MAVADTNRINRQLREELSEMAFTDTNKIKHQKKNMMGN